MWLYSKYTCTHVLQLLDTTITVLSMTILTTVQHWYMHDQIYSIGQSHSMEGITLEISLAIIFVIHIEPLYLKSFLHYTCTIPNMYVLCTLS